MFPDHTALALAKEQGNSFHTHEKKEILNVFIILQHLRFISIDIFLIFFI